MSGRSFYLERQPHRAERERTCETASIATRKRHLRVDFYELIPSTSISKLRSNRCVPVVSRARSNATFKSTCNARKKAKEMLFFTSCCSTSDKRTMLSWGTFHAERIRIWVTQIKRSLASREIYIWRMMAKRGEMFLLGRFLGWTSPQRLFLFAALGLKDRIGIIFLPNFRGHLLDTLWHGVGWRDWFD